MAKKKVVHIARKTLSPFALPLCSGNLLKCSDWEIRWTDTKKPSERWCVRCKKKDL